MAFTQFHEKAYVKTFDTGVTEQLASFTLDAAMELKYIVLNILKNGTAVGSESMTLKVFSSTDFTKPAMFSSSARLLSSTGAANGQSWFGNLRFDFDRKNLDAVSTYYLAMSTASYTRTAMFYLGAALDWPNPIYTQLDSNLAGAKFSLIGYKERSN